MGMTSLHGDSVCSRHGHSICTQESHLCFGMVSLHRNGFLCAAERFWRALLSISFAEAQMREEGLAGCSVSLRGTQDIDLAKVEGKVQSERSHLGEKSTPCEEMS